jgi:hypothetical protein
MDARTPHGSFRRIWSRRKLAAARSSTPVLTIHGQARQDAGSDLARVIRINRTRPGPPFNDAVHPPRRPAMNVTRYAFSLILLALAASAHAQQPATTRPCADMAGASASAGGCGGPGRSGPHGRWGADYTPGWTLMTPEERQAHQQRMAGMQTHADCKAYVDQHHADMVARAKERGMAMIAQPRRDPCASLPGKPAK